MGGLATGGQTLGQPRGPRQGSGQSPAGPDCAGRVDPFRLTNLILKSATEQPARPRKGPSIGICLQAIGRIPAVDMTEYEATVLPDGPSARGVDPDA